MVDYPAFRVCLMAICCLSQCSKALYLIVLKDRICFLNTGKLWWSVLPQVESTSAQMILCGKQAFVNTQKQSHHQFSSENGSQCYQMKDKLAIYLAPLSGELSCWKPEASVVKETPNFRGEGEEDGPQGRFISMFIFWFVALFFLDREYYFFQQVPGASWKFCLS